MAELLRFAVCTFMRVFDTNPAPDVLTLPELASGLLRFQLKEKLQRRIDKEQDQVRSGLRAFREGRPGSRVAVRLARAARDAEQAGQDPEAAVQQEADRLLKQAGAQAKTDLRLWSPALYRPGARRGSDGVVHLSALVMDYDSGTPLAAARRTWAPYLHIAHTTWSHTEARPKFRVTLPLLGPVRAADWAGVWQWGADRADGAVDPAMKGVAATYALPALGGEERPHAGWFHEGDFLDPLGLGLLSAYDEAPPSTAAAGPSPFRGGFPEYRYLEAETGPITQEGAWEGAAFEEDDDWDLEAAFDEF